MARKRHPIPLTVYNHSCTLKQTVANDILHIERNTGRRSLLTIARRPAHSCYGVTVERRETVLEDGDSGTRFAAAVIWRKRRMEDMAFGFVSSFE